LILQLESASEKVISRTLTRPSTSYTILNVLISIVIYDDHQVGMRLKSNVRYLELNPGLVDVFENLGDPCFRVLGVCDPSDDRLVSECLELY
jgi:hypothetical protein